MTRTDERPLAILHLTMGAVLGGVTRYICDLSTQLRQRGHVAIAGGAAGPWRDLFAREGVEWIELPLSGGPLALWGAAGTIGRIVRERNVDLIHCHFRKPVLAARLARWRGMPQIPIVYTLHLAPIPIGGIRRWLTDFGDLVITPSEMGRQWITTAGHVPADRVTTIPHGIDLGTWKPPTSEQRRMAREAMGFAEGTTVAAYVGRFEYPKNEDWVLDVAAECRRRGAHAGFVMCGDGPNAAAIRERIAQGALGEIVRLPGYVAPLSVYHAADLVLLPSSIEGFAYVAGEAAACGVAVLRTRTAGWQETVRDGITGQVVDIDRQLFVKTAIELMDSPARLAQMGAAGAAFAQRELTMRRQVDSTLAVYRRVLASPPLLSDVCEA